MDILTNATDHSENETYWEAEEQMEEETQLIILLKAIHDALLLTVLIITMLAMGADITWRQLRDHLRRPVGVSIGLTCQFILVPFVGFLVRIILDIQGLTAVGLLIVSCSPGGVVSNIFTYYMDGDVSLSIAMTSMSTLLALGFMPLNTWLYSKAIGSFNFVIPYGKMAISMVYVTSPVAVGILIRWKMQRIAGYLTKIGSTLGFIFFISAMALELVIYPSIFDDLPLKLYFGMITMPVFGILMGYCLAWLFRRSVPVRKTIAIESGVQNVVITLAVISLSFKGQDRETAFRFPLMYGISMLTSCFIFSGLYQLYKRCLKKPVQDKTITGVSSVENVAKPLNPVLEITKNTPEVQDDCVVPSTALNVCT